jgi:hypothetical protein
MNRFAELIASLKDRASGDGILKTLDALERLDVLRDSPEGGGRRYIRLPYSCDPRSFEKRGK